jgi:hypothetical protein
MAREFRIEYKNNSSILELPFIIRCVSKSIYLGQFRLTRPPWINTHRASISNPKKRPIKIIYTLLYTLISSLLLVKTKQPEELLSGCFVFRFTEKCGSGLDDALNRANSSALGFIKRTLAFYAGGRIDKVWGTFADRIGGAIGQAGATSNTVV